MDRDPNDLRPELRVMWQAWDADMKAVGLDYILTCTLRTFAQQAACWDEGRTTPGPHASPENPLGEIVTHAKPGQSAHQYGLAFDFCIIVNGKPDWSGTDPLWDKAILLGQARGMESLRPMESAHLQHPNWRELAGVTLV